MCEHCDQRASRRVVACDLVIQPNPSDEDVHTATSQPLPDVHGSLVCDYHYEAELDKVCREHDGAEGEPLW